jgi:hypothetical protein
MSRNGLNTISKSIARDVFKIILSSDKTRQRKKLPGRMSVYIWDPSFKRDPENDPSDAGFIVRVDINRKDCSTPSIDAEAGEEDGEALIKLNIHLDPTGRRQMNEIYHELVGVVRHELEHLSQLGPLSMAGPEQQKLYGSTLPQTGKILHDINRRRVLFGGPMDATHEQWGLLEENIRNAADMGCFKSYVMCYDEMSAFVAGFMMQSRSSHTHFDTIASDYLDFFVGQKRITMEQRNEVLRWLVTWALDRYPNVKLLGKHLHN